MSNVLKQYIRENAPEFASDEFGNTYRLEGRPKRIGVLIATGKDKMGFSIISPKETFTEVLPKTKEISFDKNGKKIKKTVRYDESVWTKQSIWDYGTRLATDRANGEAENPTIVPIYIRRQIEQFKDRMKRYYK